MTTKTNQPCISCDSSDALAIYEDGTGYCFSCKSFFSKEAIETGEVQQKPDFKVKTSAPLREDVFLDVPSRGLKKDSLEQYGVSVIFDTTNGEPGGLSFPVYRDGNLVGYKEKDFSTKQFSAQGSTKKPDLFGMNKTSKGGKLLIITEGEEDCMSAYQMLKEQGKYYNVVSLPNGANPSAVKNNLEFIESFDTIILNFDMDDPGQKCAVEVADIITPGKVKIMELSTKDANDLLRTGVKASREYINAVYKARPYRPDGVVSLADSWDLMFSSENQDSVPYPWEGVNKKLYGMRNREIVTLTAGSGVGKSALVRELEHWLLKNTEDNIGILALEESVARTSWGIVSIEANLPLSIREERQDVATEDIREWYDNTLGQNRIFTLDHFGSTSEDNLLNRVRYMIKGLGCKWIVLDHLSIVVSAMDDMGDERRAIDRIMTKLRQLTEETNAGMFLVSHLRRVDGNRGHEQGVEVSLSHLRGSQAIAQLSDCVIAAERNQQADDDREANLTTLRILKNRYAGLTGIAAYLAYDPDTGRLTEIEDIKEYLYPEEDI